MTTGHSAVDRAYSAASRTHSPSAEYPQLGLRVLLVGNCFLSGAIQLFAKAGCTAARDLGDADLVVYLGGVDIDPQLYGERALGCTYFSAARDAVEVDVFAKALEADVPQFGICRGMQFLHAMAGGKLYQDVDNHTTSHTIIDVDGNVMQASSMHHQMCVEDPAICIPLAYAEQKGLGRTYASYAKYITDPTHDDLEAAIYPSINALGVQGHPEVGGYPEYSAWCMTQIKSFLDDKRMLGHNSRETFVLGPKGRAHKVETPTTIDPERLPQSIIDNV